MRYEIGDYVVKPGNGVCRVEDILHLDISGADTNQLYLPSEQDNINAEFEVCRFI